MKKRIILASTHSVLSCATFCPDIYICNSLDLYNNPMRLCRWSSWGTEEGTRSPWLLCMCHKGLQQDPRPDSSPPKLFPPCHCLLQDTRTSPSTHFTAKNLMDRLSCICKCILLNRPYKIVTDFCVLDLHGAPFCRWDNWGSERKVAGSWGSPSWFCSPRAWRWGSVPETPFPEQLVRCLQLMCVRPESAPWLPVASNGSFIITSRCF